ncbi:MAG: DNA translocase FtsK 4TM domain-containing protein [Paludibacteraceae bacterium]|nr:DNA translocase FtsK 4TM domain-containing protein [Paludibacteraceae bacterium]
MAKKESKAKKEKKPSKVMMFLRDERFHFALGVVMFFVSLYVMLALVSFFFTGGADQNIVLADGISRADMKRQVLNWTGVNGALMSHYLINECFGVSVFALLLTAFAVSVRLLGVEVKALWKWIVFPLLFIVWAPLMMDFFFGGFLATSFVNIGGAYGAYLSDYLISNIGWPGTLFVILGSFIVFAGFTFSATIPAVQNIFISKKRYNSLTEDNLPHIEDTEITEDTDTLSTLDDVEELEGIEIVEEVATDNEEITEDCVQITDEIVQSADDRVQSIDDNEVITEEVEIVDNVDNVDTKDKIDVEIESVAAKEEERVEENLEPYDPTLDLSYYKYPTLDLLKEYPNQTITLSEEEKMANRVKITTTLKNFGIGVKKIFETIGPTITLYEIVPEDGIRISKIKNLESDIMLSLAATGIRIIAPMPGKGTIGIEVPNLNPKIVSMHATIASKKFQESKMELPVALGRTITNEVFMFDLAKAPHLLVAGATGQGKSVGLNAIITSLLYKKHPSQLKFVLVDPKMVEFSMYRKIDKHFLAQIPDAETPVITDTSLVLSTLNSLVQEMEDRYKLLMDANVRNIKEYNDKFINRRLNPYKGHKYLPYLVIIIDEFGDFIMTAGKEVETPIARIAQKARAVGMHLILATQRPSVNIITGVIKANFPARMAFKVSSGIDSKTILDQSGAQQLIGRGDLLYLQGDSPVRVQCAFVDTPEVENVVEYISEQQGYPAPFELPEPPMPEGENKDLSGVDLSKRDPYFEEVARFVVTSQMGSTSYIQRKYNIGFNRAGRIMDQLEVAGIVGPARGSKPREVLVASEVELESMLSTM